MKLIGNYSDDIRDLIKGEVQYTIPYDIQYIDELELNSGRTPENFESFPEYSSIVKLSVFSGGLFLSQHELEKNKDFYYKNNEIYLRPNEVLDRENFREGSYTLQFEFIQRYDYQRLYISEISQTRKEIRLRYQNVATDNLPKVNTQKLTNFLNEQNKSFTLKAFDNDNSDNNYKFNGFIELSTGTTVPINSYAIDKVTHGNDGLSVVLKLNTPLPTNINVLNNTFNVVRNWQETQREQIYFVDKDQLADGGQRGLEIDLGFLPESSNSNDTNEYRNYNTIVSSSGENLINDINNDKKDINLNIDFSDFKNHVFFGSAQKKLENFKDKAVKLEGLYFQLSSSLSISSSLETKEHRKDLFKKIRQEKETFTVYERFMYNDNQSTTINSAPGLGANLAGSNFKNSTSHNYQILSGSSAEGFEKLHTKTLSDSNLHLFTNKFHVEDPPFFNTNDFVYLSFILKNTGSLEQLHISGGQHNTGMLGSPKNGYQYKRSYRMPFNAFSGSAISNSAPTGSHFKRYVFKSQQNYFRPEESEKDIFSISDYTATSTKFEILSGSNIRKASTSGSIGDGFAYGIRDSSGQQTQQIFPNVVDQNNLSNTFEFITGSFLPQGDLFPIFVNSAINKSHFTDVRISYNDPSNVHPFNNVYRPPSGSYGGSDEWNSWYTNALATASLYDTNNVHSLVNNLPLTLRSSDDHIVLRNFVHMLGEQFDLLRNYIDNYHNFYKLGYTNPSSMPPNLMPILGDSVGWELLNTQKNNSIEDYATSTAGDEIGIQNVINSTWKKVLNNLIYVYKVKGTTESINSLLNLYGFDSSGFQMREYGGSTAEHNPTIITNDSQDFLEGMKNIKGNVSFIKDVQPFPMMNFRGTNSLGIDWWRNDAESNGIEFVFNADRSSISQTILRSSGSNEDLWDLRLIPSASSTTTASLEFRLNYSDSGSTAIATNAISMSSPHSGEFTSGKIWNVFLQKNIVTGSNQHNQFTQSYHMFIARKDDDKIRDVSHISMSSDQFSVATSSYANYNFGNQHVSKTSNNLFVGESLSGSLSELRTWNAYVSMSKFKQHTINYQSIVGNKITSSVDDLIYRYKFDENIVDWSTTPNSASLKLHDANSTKGEDYSIFIASQSNFNYATTMTEQTFYKLAVKGTDKLPNDNQTNLVPKMTIAGELSADSDVLGEPTDKSGQSERQFTNKFGRDMSYVNAIDSFVVNQLPDFRVDDFIGDPDEQDTETYEDLLGLRKTLIGDTRVSIDVEANIRAAEDLLTDEVKDTIEIMTPAKTNFEMFYDVKNDTLFRSKLGKNAKIQTQLNPNKAIGKIDAGDFDEPTINSFVNNNVHNGTIDADNSDEPTLNGFVNNNVHNGTIDADNSDEPTLSSFLNTNLTVGTIDADQWDEPTLNASYESFTSNTKINYVNLSKSTNEKVFNVTPKVGSHDMNQVFLGPKNHIGKNQGTGVNNRFFKSKNPGINGNYNTYKFENRFTFKMIGDTERFANSQSIHDNFNSFRERNFVDKNDVNNYKYKSFFGVGGADGALKDGRMVGRTRFYSSSNGEIFYPSNHFIHARTSKDALWNLIYKGTQHNGTNPTQDPIDRDPNPKTSAYIIRVGGADTVQRIKVERPVSITQRQITIIASGANGAFTFELFKRTTSLGSVELHTRGSGGLNRNGSITFGITGNIRDYNYKITPSTAGQSISNVRPVREIIKGRPAKANASITKRRQRDNSLIGTFTEIRGNFSIRVRLRN